MTRSGHQVRHHPDHPRRVDRRLGVHDPPARRRARADAQSPASTTPSRARPPGRRRRRPPARCPARGRSPRPARPAPRGVPMAGSAPAAGSPAGCRRPRRSPRSRSGPPVVEDAAGRAGRCRCRRLRSAGGRGSPWVTVRADPAPDLRLVPTGPGQVGQHQPGDGQGAGPPISHSGRAGRTAGSSPPGSRRSVQWMHGAARSRPVQQHRDVTLPDQAQRATSAPAHAGPRQHLGHRRASARNQSSGSFSAQPSCGRCIGYVCSATATTPALGVHQRGLQRRRPDVGPDHVPAAHQTGEFRAGSGRAAVVRARRELSAPLGGDPLDLLGRELAHRLAELARRRYTSQAPSITAAVW